MTNRTRRAFFASLTLLASLALFAAGGVNSVAIAGNCGLERPVKVIVGYGAGGGTDSYARILASVLPEFLDETPVVVINKPGGAQVVAMKFVKGAAPNGLTLQVTAMGGGLMSTMLRDHGISWFEDFVPIAQFGETNQALVVRRDSGITTAAELIDSIKTKFADGQKTRWSHPGRGSVSHVGVTAFLELNGILGMTQDVPFKGGAETRNALISGEVDFSASGVHTVPAFNDILLAVGVLADQRDSVVSDIPTLKEQGIGFVPTSSPIVLAAPKGVPEAFVACMSKAVVSATQHRAFVNLTKKAQQAIVYRGSGDAETHLQGLASAWAPTIAEVRSTLNQ